LKTCGHAPYLPHRHFRHGFDLISDFSDDFFASRIAEKDFLVPLRKVDVMDKAGAILHTYSITLGAETLPRASDFERAALKEASAAKLVPEGDLIHLTARMRKVVARAQPTAALNT
jgi:hypothetical protein